MRRNSSIIDVLHTNKKELYLWIGCINIGGKGFEDRDSSNKGVVRMLSSNVKNHFGNTVKY